ncbi:MAG: PAS domain S-box protein [Oxalobacteraceae bacterium]|nr:MAG: PAS domain S-box protein [Oxalobacteraceae bacterium]
MANAGETDLAALAEGSPAMLWRGDAQGRCVYLNRAMREFWGLAPEDCSTFEWSSSLLAEDHAAVFGPFAIAMAAAQPFTCEGRYRRNDAEVRVLRTRASPYHDTQGLFAGMVGVNEDITELRNAEQSLFTRNEELSDSLVQLKSIADRFTLATSISGLAMSEHDDQLRYTWAHNVPNSLGKTPRQLVGPDLGEPLERLLRRTIESKEKQSEEISFLMGEQRLWVDIQATPATLPDGRPGVVASALDVTSRKLNEAKLQVLARELGHRVKNVFAVVQAVIRQSARATTIPRTFVDAVDARLVALARAQDALLNMSDDRFDLATLLKHQLSHLNRVHFEGPDVLLPGRLAPYLSLAVHELGTNALKYGSLRGSHGTVRLTWSEHGSDQLRINWVEQGDPNPTSSSGIAEGQRKGFGSQLLTKVFEGATGGKCCLSLEPEGLTWTATVKTAVELSV